MNYDETLNYIHSLGMHSNPPQKDLGRIKYLCGLFGDPQDCYKTIHVAGTNGKGSAVAMLANITQELGYKTGRYISPFIEKFNERIAVNGADIANQDIIYYAGKIKEAIGGIPKEYMPNEFEFVTLMAFLYYRDKNCDIIIIETGLGGSLDPTNAIKSPLASVIMSVGLDHMQILGDTIEQIAAWKCGIIKQNSQAVIYPLNSQSVIDIAKNTAREKNCGFILPDIDKLKITEENINFARFEYKNKIYKTKLAGRHQIYNAVTVIETIDCLFKNSENNYNAVYNGIEKTFFPARFEILSENPKVIFDGAHNIPAIAALKDAINNLLPGKKIILVCGMLKDKNPGEALKEICAEPFVYKFIAAPVESPRSETPENLCGYAAKYCKNAGYDYSLQNAVKIAMAEASAGENLAVVCFGSLYLAAGVKKLF